MLEQPPPASFFDASLADECHTLSPVPIELADRVFDYFKNAPLFRWRDANNDCEDRANALCILLDEWGIPNCKAWVFSGTFRRKEYGFLTNYWKYHVATALPVQQGEDLVFFVIDPATVARAQPLKDWALQVTESGSSYHFVKNGTYYIFPAGKIEKENWHKRNKRNHNWTMQGLTGINGTSATGKAQLAFLKKRVKQTVVSFQKLKDGSPF